MTPTGPKTLPQSFTLLIGPPRSGTTLIANTFMSHSTVCGVIEPFQQGRTKGYETTALPAFQNDHALDFDATPNLAIKETTTRLRNVELSLALAQDAQSRGVYTGLILILRCPFEAFLSQVDASRTHWTEKKLTDINEDTVAQYFSRLRSSLKLICTKARRFHVRIVSYAAFCASPEPQTARLMALVPVPIQPRQLRFTPDPSIIGEADPKFASTRGAISKTDRTDAVGTFIETYKHLHPMAFAQELRALATQDEVAMTPAQKLDALTALAL